jgi:uncharacterized membrane protein HdeD (DUF308 family)
MLRDPRELETATRAGWTSAAGWLVIGLSAGTALLPVLGTRHGAAIIGVLLIVAGLAEVGAGAMRSRARGPAMLAGAITALAGLLFWSDPATKLLPAVTIITAWLFLRGIILAITCLIERGSVRFWTGVSAATDVTLGMILAIGISISTLVISLFGATPPLIASFAWFLAASFIVNGLLLLEIASCTREMGG